MLNGRHRMAKSVISRKIAKNQKSAALLMHIGGSLKAKAGVQAAEIGWDWKILVVTATRHQDLQHIPTIFVPSKNLGTLKMRR